MSSEAEEGVLPSDWRTLSPEAKKALLHKLRGMHISRGLGGPREWRQKARPKQLPPDDPGHWLPDGNGFACGCQGPDERWNIWFFLAGRGCVAGHTRIWLPLENRFERIDVLAQRGKPVTVRSLTKRGPENRTSDGAPFLKGMAQLYEVHTSDGNRITVTDQHLFLTPQGWLPLAHVRAGQLLAGGAPSPQEEVSAFRQVSPADVPSSRQKAAGSPAGYQMYPRYDDQLPLPEAGNDRSSAPSRSGAGERSRLQLQMDDCSLSREYSRLHRLSNLRSRSNCGPPVPSVPGEAGPAASGAAGQFPHYRKEIPPFPGMTSLRRAWPGCDPYPGTGNELVTSAAGWQESSGFLAAEHLLSPARGLPSGMKCRLSQLDPSDSHLPDNAGQVPAAEKGLSCSTLLKACMHAITWVRVLAIRPAGTGLFYDMHVPGAENYAAEGLWHHNTGKTLSGAQWVIEQALKNPGSVWAVVAPTFRDVRVTCFEGPSGIRRALETGEEDQWRRNELRLDLINGSIIYGYSADQPERLRGSNLNGAWCDEMGCLSGSTLIRTETGLRRIDQMCAGQRVWTRRGLRSVLWAGPTRRNTEMWEIRTADGKSIRCTPDHRVWTEKGWVEAQYVTPGATLQSWKNTRSSWDRLPGSSGMASAGTESTNRMTREPVITGILAETSFTSLSGNELTGLFQQGTSSITSTKTRRTITSATWSCWSAGASITESIRKNGSTLTGKRTVPARQQWNELTGSGLSARNGKLCVHGAGNLSSLRACELNSVAAPAGRENVVIVSGRLPYREEVTYDLTVEGEPEFFANGILVHNSWGYEATWYEGLIPALRIGEHPRVLVTTTPRPTRLIRDLLGRRDGTVHITRASTWENAANLSAAALDELRRRYEGTRLGRQELEGELLDDLEGALWRRSDIDAARVKPADVPQLTRVVVAIDPAMTSGEDSDETGIVVAGEDGHGHGYVLADLSMRGSPEACMRKAVDAYRHYQADCIVAEVNNGGDFIGSVIRTVDASVPYRQVRASRGKAIRAEPVSTIYEQHRVHHVGSFPDLEDQMCCFMPGIPGPSPDRMDALVWAMYELRSLSEVSWMSAYGVRRCGGCGLGYPESALKCPRCGKEAPPPEVNAVSGPDAEEDEPAPGSWAAVYHLRRCPAGHSYSGKQGTCPQCRSSVLGYLKQHGRGVAPSSMLTS